jgi:histidinol phosphatase-like PHP family hydrolase
MKGIPSKNNFYVFNVITNEKKEFKTKSDVAREYNINYYTAIIKKLSGIEAEIRPPKQLETPEDYAAIESEGLYNTYLFGKFGNKI